MTTPEPSAWDATCNPSAYRRWREATAANAPIRACGCPHRRPPRSPLRPLAEVYNTMTEMWKPIPGWENYYEVSDLGRIKSCARSVSGRPGRTITVRERILTQSATRDGYACVTLCRDGIRHFMRVHRAVLLAFVGPCPDGMEACHRDGDAGNNALWNLRWDTRSSNTFDKVAHGTHPMARKTSCLAGHPFDEENTYTTHSGARQCRECKRARKIRAREGRAA